MADNTRVSPRRIPPRLTEADMNARTMRARIAAHESWAQTPDRTARTAKARQAAADRFLALVDDSITDPVARLAAAESLRSAHFTRLAYRSAQARRKQRAA